MGTQGPVAIAGLIRKPGGHSAALPVAPELGTTSTLKGGLRETKFCAGEDEEGQEVRGTVSLRAEQTPGALGCQGTCRTEWSHAICL